MSAFFITFRSVTYAQQAQSHLERKGIGCTLQRTPHWMEERGCGYCLRTSDGNRAVILLRQQGLPFRKVYHRAENGNLEEVQL